MILIIKFVENIIILIQIMNLLQIKIVLQANPKPEVSLIAHINLSCKISFEGYSGKSSQLKHVCPYGSLMQSFARILVIQNFSGPFIPCKLWNPSTGTFELPVTNWRKFPFSVRSRVYMISQNQIIYGELALYPLQFVCCFKSETKQM